MQASQVLFQGEALPRALPVCDHYAGTEVRMRKALALQAELGPVFDITFDCEDGAPVGKEAEHAQLVAEILLSSDNRFNRVGVRIHDASHPCWKADVATLIDRARGAVSNPLRAAVPETSTCHETHDNRTGSIGGATRRIGGRPSPTGAEDRLGALLAFRSRPTRKG